VQLYDVQFYPYTPPGVDPVFAVTGRANVGVLFIDSCLDIAKSFRPSYVDLLHLPPRASTCFDGSRMKMCVDFLDVPYQILQAGLCAHVTIYTTNIPKPEATKDGLNSLAWSQDPDTGDPLVCVSGHDPKIKVLNVRKDELVRVINDQNYT